MLSSAQTAWLPGEVLLYIEAHTTVDQVDRALRPNLPMGVTVKSMEELHTNSRYHRLRFSSTNGTTEKEVEQLVARVPGVRSTSMNYRVEFHAEPNDALYGFQWNMEDINVEPVWNTTTGGTMANGKRIGVGLSDLAIQTNHPDLQGNIWPGSPAQGSGADHGTEVASVMGAVGNNGIGIAGVNWDVEILASGETQDLSDAIEQFEIALDLREQFNATGGQTGLLVVSITASWGVENAGTCGGFISPLFSDMTDAGIILVATGPNAQVSMEPGTDFPANCAVAEHLVVTSYGPSNQTPYSFGPNTVHLLAPGLDIPVATLGGGYAMFNGNSYAVPTVAGAVALLYSIPCPSFAALVMNNPEAARTLVKNAILNNTAPFPGGGSLTITGGKLDVFAAYQALMAQCVTCTDAIVSLTTPAGADAQYTVVNGAGFSVAQGTGDEIGLCETVGCFSATVLDSGSLPVNGTFTVTVGGNVVASGSIVNGSLSFVLGTPVQGCTDPSASNYDVSATCDDGTCCAQNAVTIYLIAADENASGTAQLSVVLDGNTLFNGPVTIAPDAQEGLSYGTMSLCAEGGCYSVLAEEGDVALQSGMAQIPGGPFTEFFFQVGVPTTIPVGAQATEVCDGIDNDCDGQIDEDFIWYADADGDGYGDTSTEQVLCTPPGSGFAQLAGDCDDTDPEVNPGRFDSCTEPDGVDNNCNGIVDDGEIAWYPDLDNDEFGADGQVVMACEQPIGHVANNSDCDDTDSAIFPGATESCDGIDNDCDGSIDEDFLWYADADGDGFGDDATAQASCTPIPGMVNVGGDCDDTDPAKQRSIRLALIVANQGDGGTAHYTVTQGSTVTEGDVVLAAEGFGFGLADICIAQGCFSISITELDVALGESSSVQTAPGEGFQPFNTTEGFFGSAGSAAPELCDGLDNDCDGEVDEDFNWYVDADGDGFGDLGTGQFSCTPVPGSVQVSGDCNDAEPNLTIVGAACDDGDPATQNDIVRPNCTCLGFVQGNCPLGEIEDCNGNCAPAEWVGDGFCDDGSFEHEGIAIFFNCAEFNNDGGDCGNPCTTEVCDGFDNDCDGIVDNGFIWYTDGDGDGYGAIGSEVLECVQPSGSVAVGGDCDDTNSAVHPGASEVCDGIDNNCDGIIDGNTVDLQSGCTNPLACNYDPNAICDDGSCSLDTQPNGNEVYSPDWTLEDTDGNFVELYALLDQGYTVILDLFTTWCPPSQIMLTNGYLNDWNQHLGPDGLDHIRMVSIEMEDTAATSLVPFTNLANWPIIGRGGPAIADLYAALGLPINAFPTILMICPDRSVTKIYGLGADLLPGNFFAYDYPEGLALLNNVCGCHSAPCTGVYGCTDPASCNYNPSATCSDGSCIPAPIWYADEDGDGYGFIYTSVLACSQPTGFVANHTDCNDADPNSNPDAVEVCDGVDNNCDGFVDEGFEPSLTCPANVAVTADLPGCQALVVFDEPALCGSGTVAQIGGPPSGSTFDQGITLITFGAFNDIPSNAVFAENFANNSAGWAMEGEWAIGAAVPNSGCECGDDPAQDHTTTADNGLAGMGIGACVSNAVHGFVYLTSPAVDVSAVQGPLVLKFYRHLHADYLPYMEHVVQVFNGSIWSTVWSNNEEDCLNDLAWTLQQLDVTGAKNNAFQVRFGQQVLDPEAFNTGGWSVDDVSFLGDLAPIHTCSFQVTVEAPDDNNNNIPDCAESEPCTENVTMELRTDALSSQASWEILDQNTATVLCQFSVPINGITSPITENCCLPVGCYRLRVHDSGGDGFVSSGITGGYQLREASGFQRRIIDNLGNFATGSASTISSSYDNGAFCVPIGNDRPIFSSCEKLDWVTNKFIVATENSTVSAQYGVSNTTSGYEFWFFDPNGTYSFRRFRNHATSDGYGAGATRACHFRLNAWTNTVTTPHLPNNVLLNVRIRGRVAGANQPFGPACLFKMDAARAACPLVKLQDNPLSNDYSCGVNRYFSGSNTAGNRIIANPPQPIPTVSSGNVRYQFRFRNGEYPNPEGCIVRPPQTSAQLNLNWSAATGTQLKCNTQYDVDVRVSLDGGATWCVGNASSAPALNCADPGDPSTAWGKVCSVNITTSTTCPGPLQSGSSSLAVQNEGDLTMYPNPNRGDQLFINLSEVGADVTTVSVDIYDLTGKRVTARTIQVQDGFVNTAMDLNGAIANGTYMVNITAGVKMCTERLVIQK